MPAGIVFFIMYLSLECFLLNFSGALTPPLWSILGEVVGACSITVGHGVGMLKKIASVKMFHHTSDVQSITSYPLRKKVGWPSFL